MSVEHPTMNEPTSVVQTRVVHNVHRRASTLLLDAAARPDAPAASLREVRDFLVTTLRHHHICEDEHLWPLIVARDPGAREALDEMTREHEELETTLDALEEAAIADGASPSAAFAGAAAALRDLIHRHEHHEEEILFPALRSVVSDEEWREFAEYVSRTDTTVGPHLMVGFIDMVATPEEAATIFGGIPEAVRESALAPMRARARATIESLER